MVLPLFQQQIHDIDVRVQRCRPSDLVKWGRAALWFANLDPGPLRHRHDLRNRSLAIEHEHGLTFSNRAKVLAQMRFQLRDAYLLHDHMMTTSGPIAK